MSLAEDESRQQFHDGDFEAPTELPPKPSRFLAVFVRTGNITSACLAVGISRSTHYKWLKSDTYAAAFHEARSEAGEYLEGVARDLATGAYQRPIVSGGKIVTYEPIYNTRLLLALLRANLPEKYGNRAASGSQRTSIKLVDRDAWPSA